MKKNIKMTAMLFGLLAILAFSCEKRPKNVHEEYIVFYEKEFLRSVPVDTTNEERRRFMIDSISRHLLVENGIDSTREIRIIYWASSFFVTELTSEEVQIIKQDNRIDSVSKNQKFNAL